MIKKRIKQLTFHDWPSGFHGARIFQSNRWVKMAQIILWDLVEKNTLKHLPVNRQAIHPLTAEWPLAP